MDNRNPPPSNENTKKVMKSNRGKGTGPEKTLRKALRDAGYPGYRLNWKKVPGRPDIAYPGKRIAIFVNGCFWHRCPKCNLPLPKTHIDFWEHKFNKNIERDRRKTIELQNLGWIVITVWECEINKELSRVVSDISNILT